MTSVAVVTVESGSLIGKLLFKGVGISNFNRSHATSSASSVHRSTQFQKILDTGAKELPFFTLLPLVVVDVLSSLKIHVQCLKQEF